jgi:hypothetical protein
VKLFAVLADGRRVPLDGPFEVHAFENDTWSHPGIEPTLKRSVHISVKEGSEAYSQASGGGTSVATSSGGYTLKIDVKRVP